MINLRTEVYYFYYYIGFNTGSLVDFIEDKSMKEVFKDDDRNIDENFIEMHDEWVEMGYGFMTPLAYENQE